ncbi:MAG: DUF3800 domain-containing protein [Hyphomonadaceae bacterium]
MKHYYAYIDEAGDEGFGKLKLDDGFGQSRWFLIGSIIVTKENNLKLPTWKRELREKFPEKKKPDLHWSGLTHDQRRALASGLAAKPVGAAVMMSHKVTIPGSQYEDLFKKPQYLYNYLVRWQLERLIAACEMKAARDKDKATLHLSFSRRAGTDYEVMRDYLKLLAAGKDIFKAPRKTNWAVLDIEGIEVEDHSQRAGLQMADWVTSAFFNAVEPNRFGDTEQVYANRLRKNLLRSNATSRNCGLTLVGPNKPSAREKKFFKRCWEIVDEE